MDRTDEQDRQAWRRIVALLFAFAALADSAGARPWPIRIAVLWLLRAAETIAREFVVAVARECAVEPDLAIPPHAHDITDDAGRLARSFAALAELLAALTLGDLSVPVPGRISGPVNNLMQALRNLTIPTAAPALPSPDTS